MTPVATPGFNPNDPYGHMQGGQQGNTLLANHVLPRVLGLLEPRERTGSPMNQALMAMGAGILGAKQGENWFGAGAKAFSDSMAQAMENDTRQQSADTYAAQTMLQTLNQAGYQPPNAGEMARGLKQTTFYDPQTGQTISGIWNPFTQQFQDYQGNPLEVPPGAYEISEQRMPGMAGGQGASTPGINVGALDPEEYTPESLQRAVETGDLSVLEWREPPDSGGSGGGASGKDTAKYKTWSYMVEQLNPLLEELEKNPTARNTLGTMGAWGAKLTAGLGMFDKLAGTDYKEAVKQFYGGLDPREVKSEVDRVVLPVAKIMVDPSGPLANQEQLRAQLQTGVDTLEKGSTWSDPDQAYKTLTDTLRIMAGATDIMSGGGGESTPPVMEAIPPQQPSPSGDVLRYNPATGRVE